MLHNPLPLPTVLVPAALALHCAQSVSFEPSFCHLPRERKNRDRRHWDRPKFPAESLFMMIYVMTEMQWDRGLDKHSSDLLWSHTFSVLKWSHCQRSSRAAVLLQTPSHTDLKRLDSPENMTDRQTNQADWYIRIHQISYTVASKCGHLCHT